MVQILKPHFTGRVIKGPHIADAAGTRELCDVLALSNGFAFIFESKAFSVFDKKSDQKPERRAKTIMGHFEKAARQLQGAVRKIQQGVQVLCGTEESMSIRADQYDYIHCIVLVSTLNWQLPWTESGRRLSELCRPRVWFHLMTAMELQAVVAFTKGRTDELHQCLNRRADWRLPLSEGTRKALAGVDWKQPELTPAVVDRRVKAVSAKTFADH